MKNKAVSKLLVIVLVSVVLNFLFLMDVEAKFNTKLKLNTENGYLTESSYNLDYGTLGNPQLSYSKNIKGVYINFWTLSHQQKREKIIKLITESDLNAIVVDLKDVKGYTPFASFSIKELPYNLSKENFKKLISKWQKKGIYVIGRLAVFKDHALTNNKKSYALKYSMKSGSIISTVNSDEWANPYSKDVWNYNINIAKEMAELGLDEIQFDYIRFPTLSKKSKLVIKANKKMTKSDAVVGFLKQAKRELNKYNIIISADLFGLTTTIKGDLGIGQNIIKVAKYVDYISPMIYPSHYGKGMYGITEPASNPYQIIANSLSDAKKKLGPASKKIRPWLQDFSLYHSYTKKEIKAQIKAVEDKKLSSWLLWNPKSIYTIEALISNTEKGDV